MQPRPNKLAPTREPLYESPANYAMAFGYRDVAAETWNLRECAARHSARPVRDVLEIACGHAPHAPHWIAAGCAHTGLDASMAMLRYAQRETARRSNKYARFVCGDLAAMPFQQAFDLAYVLLGSIYAPDTQALIRHFDGVAAALRRGGLYVMEWCVDFEPFVDYVDSWTHEYDHVRCTTLYRAEHLNRIEQTILETVEVSVETEGITREFVATAQKRVMYPQEFLQFIRQHPSFEFVGWWNDWNLDEPLEQAASINRPLIAIRRV